MGSFHPARKCPPRGQRIRHWLSRYQLLSHPRSVSQPTPSPSYVRVSTNLLCPPRDAGQTMVTNLCEVTKTVTQQNKNGSWSFLIPRFFNGGTIIGGTKETDDWRANASSSTRERLLTSGLALEPYARSSPAPSDRKAAEVTVLSDVVGRRPTRQGGMRLELQEPDLKEADGGSRSCRLIHAYGAGGRGYEISWGVADEVLQLARPLLQSNMETAPLT